MNARSLASIAAVFCVVVSLAALEASNALAAGPQITQESFSNIGSTDATVSAQVDAGGSPTGYRVEYGTGGVDESSTPETNVGAPESAVGVGVQLTGLQSGV